MATYTVTIPDEFAFGVEAARGTYNEDHPDTPFETDAEYVQFVMASAAESWHKAYGVGASPAMVDRLEIENAELRAQLAAKK